MTANTFVTSLVHTIIPEENCLGKDVDKIKAKKLHSAATPSAVGKTFKTDLQLSLSS